MGWAHNRAAKAAKVTPEHVSRLLNDPSFVAKVEQFRAGILDAARGHITSLWSKASARLEELLDDPDPKIRLGAIREIRSSVPVTPQADEAPALPVPDFREAPGP